MHRSGADDGLFRAGGILSGRSYDLAIIGGGVNGCGIARDAAGRGLSVFLCEQGDLGGATSSSSTKLIHGGLRYLEYYEFRLVREALAEREVLLRAAPHIIRPLRFVLPHHSGLRPRWLLRLGLFFYDHLGGRRILPPTRSLNLARDPAGEPLKSDYRFAFEYSDCWVDDARLVMLNAVDARSHGASIHPRSKCLAAERSAGGWTLTVQDVLTGDIAAVTAGGLVNAAGPWVADVLRRVVRANAPAQVRLVKGSHIVLHRLFDHDRAYIFQNADGRIVFAIPYEGDFTLVGTTDVDHRGEPDEPAIGEDEITYLLAVIREYFHVPVERTAIVWSYSGVRPLYDDGASSAQEATRDYVLELDAPPGKAPLLSVFGGKITTYRRLAEQALSELGKHLPVGRPWTAKAPLPGGDFPFDGFADLVRSLGNAYPFLAEAHLRRLVRAYGTRTVQLMNGAKTYADLGHRFGADLTEAEVIYLAADEWAETADDILWRRSKLGLRLTAAECAALQDFLDTNKGRTRRRAAGGKP